MGYKLKWHDWLFFGLMAGVVFCSIYCIVREGP
jgi:hypothetical protein